jgi:hypothetical protein
MNLDDILCKILFVKKKKRKRDAEEDIEEEYEEVRPKKGKQVSDDIDWDDEKEVEPEKLVEEFQVEKKGRVKVPKGKVLINVNKRAWLHIIMGSVLVIVNVIFFGVGTVGWMSRIEEKILVTLYALPSIYVTMMFTWMKIQGEPVGEEFDE